MKYLKVVVAAFLVGLTGALMPGPMLVAVVAGLWLKDGELQHTMWPAWTNADESRCEITGHVTIANDGTYAGELWMRTTGLFVSPESLARYLRVFLDGGSPEQTEPAPMSRLTRTPRGYRGRSVCFSHVGYGPLRLYSQSPFQALRLGIRPRTPSTLGAGQHQANVTSTWVNLWLVDGTPEHPGRFYVDGEMLQIVAALSYGITDSLEVEGEIQERSRFGGAMDGFIQGFHDLFGIDQEGRLAVPQGEFHVLLDPGDGRPAVALGAGDRGLFSGGAQVSLQHNLTCGRRFLPALSWSATARYEIQSSGDLSGGGRMDFGASAAFARRFRKFYVYGTLGLAWFGREEFHGIELKDRQFTALLAGEWRFRRRQSVLVQALVTGGLIDGFGPFSERSNEITLGYKREFRENIVLELGLIENAITYDNSPDFGLHAGLSRRF